MRAKRLSDGAIIDVDDMPVYGMKSDKECYKCLSDGHHYPAEDLDFTLSEPEEEVVIEGWVCRDKDGDLSLFYNSNKPSVEDGDEYWSVVFGNELYLPKEYFPNIKWLDEPQSVAITIKPKKNDNGKDQEM